jgi:hypothetical protein
MWLNGFNDNLPGFPRSPCKYIPCSKPYMGDEQPGAPVDPTKPMRGPYGTGMSSPSFGMCPVGRDWIKENNPLTGRDWISAPAKAPPRLDDTDNVMTLLAYKKISAYSGIGHGFYFWNFRTDIDEPHWSYLLALERGWIPDGNFNDPKIQNSCRSEDEMAYKCIIKRDMTDASMLKAVHYILKQKNGTETEDESFAMDLTGKELHDAANNMIEQYFQEEKGSGVTCDFGGVAMLVEENRTVTDDDFVDWDVAYFTGETNNGLNWWELGSIVLFGIGIGTIIGFVIGMRKNKGFHDFVAHTKFGRRVTRSKSAFLKNTLSLTDLGDALDEYYGSPTQNNGHYGSTTENASLLQK